MSINKKAIEAVATAVRTLTMDAVQKANSGHPGQPMGCAELGALLFGEIMNHFPRDPQWINRDRFILSAGHGSTLLYSLLHLSGYDLSLEDIKDYRQFGSKTPGHPEYGLTPGVEATTGPLGQGIGNAVGMAIAERMLAARFNSKKKILDHHIYVLVGDGDLMEGVSAEACSLAGHLGLGKLIVFYDSNRITIEGSTDLAFTEDVRKRFESYHWQTFSGNAYDLEGIMRCVREAKKEIHKPTLIILKSVIAKGAPNLAGSHKAHGAPLGEKEVRATKRAIGVPEDSLFYIPKVVTTYFAEKLNQWEASYRSWQELFFSWVKENPQKYEEWKRFFKGFDLKSVVFPHFQEGDKIATRKASSQVLNAIAQKVPNLIGGSADLAPSNKTELKDMGSFQANNNLGRNLHFGVREHAMGAIVNGIALYKCFRPFCSTFLVFSDYMRPSIRLAALMGLPVIYVFTHDSIFIGEDGPTHQPVEQLATLRAIPELLIFRPGDAEETAIAWKMAMDRTCGPTVLALSRQALTVYHKEDVNWHEEIRRGAYIVSDSKGPPEIVLIATGSEVNLALEVKKILSFDKIRVVSMMCRELFLKAPQNFRDDLIPGYAQRIVLEAGVKQGWTEIAGPSGYIKSVECFGKSAPALELSEYYGFSAKTVVTLIRTRKESIKKI